MKNLDDAIRHCLQTAAINENCQECREEHIQLAEWLTELKVRRMMQMPPMYSISSQKIPPFPDNIVSQQAKDSNSQPLQTL